MQMDSKTSPAYPGFSAVLSLLAELFVLSRELLWTWLPCGKLAPIRATNAQRSFPANDHIFHFVVLTAQAQ
jgi:hypothetical protein